jgi:hypothetical protein
LTSGAGLDRAFCCRFVGYLGRFPPYFGEKSNIGINSSLIQGMPAGVNKVCMNNVGGAAALALDGRMDDGVPNTGNFHANADVTPNASAATTDNVDTLYTVCNRM